MANDALKIKNQKEETNITFTAIIKNKNDLFNADGQFDEPILLEIFRDLNDGDQIHFEIIKKK